MTKLKILFFFFINCYVKHLFLINPTDLDVKTFVVEDRKIIFCFVVENKYTEDQIKKLFDKGIILDHYTRDEKNYLKVRCNEILYLKQYEKDLKSGIDTKISLFLSTTVNNFLMIYYTKMTTKFEELFDDLLNQWKKKTKIKNKK